jgi:hypothetical protein
MAIPCYWYYKSQKEEGKKQRKFGRNAVWCLACKNRNQRNRNKNIIG